jgi:hypothetical protein
VTDPAGEGSLFVSDVPRGRYIGERVAVRRPTWPSIFVKCHACGGWIDCRDLGSLFDHDGPLPHPDAPQ